MGFIYDEESTKGSLQTIACLCTSSTKETMCLFSPTNMRGLYGSYGSVAGVSESICLCDLMAVEDDKRSGLLTALQIVTRLVRVHSDGQMCRVMTHYLLQSTYSELDVNKFLITTVNNIFCASCILLFAKFKAELNFD